MIPRNDYLADHGLVTQGSKILLRSLGIYLFIIALEVTSDVVALCIWMPDVCYNN